MAKKYLETQIAKTKKMIERWQGGRAMIYDLCPSHYSLRVVVAGNDYRKNLLIAVAEPKHIHGPTRWEKSEIKVIPIHLASGGEGVAIVDEKNGVRIVGETFEVHENVKL